MDDNLKIIGKRIRDERNIHKWLISELSERTGLSVAHISSIERGKCNFSVECLVNISKALRVDINFLLYGKNFIANTPETFQQIINDCNQQEIRILTENAKQLKEILRKNSI